MNPGFRRFLRQQWLRELLVLALVLKALVPAGFMPDVDHGLPSLKLCAYFAPLAGAPAVQPGDADHGPAGGQPDHQEHGLCTFAATLQPSVAQNAVLLLLPLPGPVGFQLVDQHSSPLSRSATPPSRLPRGPPVLV